MNLEKGYIVLGKRTDGRFVGLVEQSFSMGFSLTEVRVWRDSGYSKGSETAEKYVAGYRKSYPTTEWNVYRVGSKECPVKIDWTSYHKGGKKSKYSWRNLKFIPRQESPGPQLAGQ